MKDKRKYIIVSVAVILVFVGMLLGGIKLAKLDCWEKEIRSVNVDGVIATVEDIQADKRQVMLTVSLKKEDGTHIDEHTRVDMIEIFSKQGISNYHTTMALSEDGKTLNYTFRVKPEIGTDMALKNVHIWFNGLMNVYEKSAMSDKSVYELYEQYPLQKSYQESKNQGYIPIEVVEKFSILGAGFTKASNISGEVFETDEPILYIRTKFLGERQTTDNEARIHGLYNERTGEEISGSYACTLYETDYENKDKEGNPQYAEIMEEYYELTDTEELKYIKSVIDYNEKEQIDHNKRTLFVKVKENVEGISQTTDLEINVEDLPLNISEVYMSPLGVAIKGKVLGDQIITKAVYIPIQLQMQDGSYVALEALSCPTEQQFILDYRGEVALDINNVVAMDIGRSRVKIKK